MIPCLYEIGARTESNMCPEPARYRIASICPTPKCRPEYGHVIEFCDSHGAEMIESYERNYISCSGCGEGANIGEVVDLAPTDPGEQYQDLLRSL